MTDSKTKYKENREVKDMEKNKLYTVTKGSSDGTLRKGYFIWLSENGDLNVRQGRGWLEKDEWNSPGTNDFKVEPNEEYELIIGSDHRGNKTEGIRKKI